MYAIDNHLIKNNFIMENTENKINTADVTVMNESGNQSMTESAVMDEVRVHSTPVSTRDLSLIHI